MEIWFKVMKKSWKPIGQNVFEPWIYIYIYIYIIIIFIIIFIINKYIYIYIFIYLYKWNIPGTSFNMLSFRGIRLEWTGGGGFLLLYLPRLQTQLAPIRFSVYTSIRRWLSETRRSRLTFPLVGFLFRRGDCGSRTHTHTHTHLYTHKQAHVITSPAANPPREKKPLF